MEAVTVVTGKSTSAPYMSFGDDSQYEGRLVYAYVFFKRTKLKSILREISLLKKRFKFPKGVDLHCRNLISGQQRKKLGLSHLSKTDVESIFRNIITIINKYKVLVRYSHASEDVKGYFDRGIEVGSNDPNMPNFMLNTRYDPKGVLGLLATMCFAINPDGSEGPIADQCEIYTSPDYTKVDFWGGVKQQAHYLTGGFSAIGAADNEVYKIESNIGGPYLELLQLADVVAYLCCHAVHGKVAEPFYYELLSKIKWKVERHFVPVGGRLNNGKPVHVGPWPATSDS